MTFSKDLENIENSENEGNLETSYVDEMDSDPASNIDCYTGRFDRTFNPRLGCTIGLPRKDSGNRVHRCVSNFGHRIASVSFIIFSIF